MNRNDIARSQGRSSVSKSHVIKVARRRSSNKIQQTKPKRKSSIIHVTLRPRTHSHSRKIHPVSSTTSSSATSSDALMYTNRSDNKSMCTSSINQSRKLRSNTLSQIKPDSSTWNVIGDTHRPKDKKKQFKCTPRNIVSMTIVSLIVAAVIAGVVTTVVLLTARKTVSISKDAYLRWNPVGITVAGVTNVSGNTSDKLSTPLALAFDYENALYIADRDNDRIQRYLPNEMVGTTVAGFGNGTYSLSPSGLYAPQGVAVDNEKTVYISNVGVTNTVVWRKGSSNWTQLISNISNHYGLFHDHEAVILYVANYGNHRILSHDLKTSTTSIVAGNNGNGTSNTQLFLPTGVFFDQFTQSMIITNFAANNIVRWRLGDTSWTLLAGNANGLFGLSSTELSQPISTVLDPMGNMYVADRANARVQLFMAGQSRGITIAGISGVHGSNASLLNTPWFAALDSQLNLYVADTGNHRVQKFLRY